MILDDILQKRREQLAREKEKMSLKEVVQRAEEMKSVCKSFSGALKKERLSVIAEIKKASPSKGTLCFDFRPIDIAAAYQKAGADALSVLTEEHYFKGGSKVLEDVRPVTMLPVLRKDFVFDEYQIYEARAIGADAVLLIAAVLDTPLLKRFLSLAGSLGMECLVEVHDEEELNRALVSGAKILGINNRNLKTFEIDMGTTERLAGKATKDCVLVSESGIKTNSDMRRVRSAGANAVLIGETLMKSADVTDALERLRCGV